MTYYASQGKTRPINAVDLNNCRTHFSYYTALSTGTTLDGTLIVQGMDASKITKGISGFLRQEFRELEILNEITKPRYEGVAMPDIHGINRKELIKSFYDWKGGHFDSEELHPVLRYKCGDEQDIRAGTVSGKWELVRSDKPKEKSIAPLLNTEKTSSGTKRKASAEKGGESKKKAKKTVDSPLGLMWDSRNQSCAYDSLFTCVYRVWAVHGPMWTAILSTINGYTRP
ncbi:hypothetical protein B0H10DRAFT_1821851 [Mycena sp. CBHHK59/15]|nr:hypothetical protein B0H10DRAFT_1821851 [Mycena sp. CBHHK59/15]